MTSAIEALERLRAGNHRFSSGTQTHNLNPNRDVLRTELIAGQQPFATILGCSDSRVPAECVFDQGLGSLFVVRVAGNVVAPTQLASIEFAATQFGTQLVVVLGHSHCGAVLATITDLQQPIESRSPNLLPIVNRIAPSVEPLLTSDFQFDSDSLLEQAVQANVAASVHQLRYGSAILQRLTHDGQLLVVGAEYSLESGRVDFFNGVGQGH